MKNLAPVGFPALAVAADATTPAGSYVGQTIYSTTTNSLLSWNGSAWKAQAAAGGGGSAITVKDEGTSLTAALSSLNFAGAGVTATNSGGDVTVTVPGASGGVQTVAGALLAVKEYAAGSDTALASTSSASFVDVDATNAVVTFTAPTSGVVIVEVESLMNPAGAPSGYFWGLNNGTTDIAAEHLGNGATAARARARFRITGLTPGSSYTYKLRHKTTGAVTSSIYTGPGFGPLQMYVYDGAIGTAGFIQTAVYANVKRAALWNITNGAYTSIPWDTLVSQSGTIWSSVTNPTRFTVSEGGTYLVTGNVHYDNTNNTVISLQIKVNNTKVYAPSYVSTPTVGNAIATSCLIDLVAGDYVEIQAYCSGATTVPAETSGIVNATGGIIKVATMGSPAFSGGQVYRATNVALNGNTWTKISWEGIEFDTSGYWNSTNPTRLTAPVAGYYEVGTEWLNTGAGASYSAFTKNGQTVDTGTTYGYVGGGGVVRPVSNTVVYLNAGDYVEMSAYIGSPASFGATSLGHARFWITYLGGNNLSALSSSVAKKDTVNVFTKNQSVAIVDLTDGGSIAVDASLGNTFRIKLGGNRVLENPTNLTDGMELSFIIKQDDTGSRLLGFGDKYEWGLAGVPTLSTTANYADWFTATYDAGLDKLLCTVKAVGFAATLAADTYINYVVGLWKGESPNNSTCVIDCGPFNHVATALGNAKVSTTKAKYGASALSFDGVNSYLQVPSHTAFDLGNTYTIEMWVYPTSLSGNYGLIHRGDYSTGSGTWNGFAFSLRWLSTALRVYFYATAFADEQRIDVNNALTLNTWNHIAVVRNGTSGYVFVNGVLQGSISGLNTPAASSQDLYIGAWRYNSGGTYEYFPGYLDDVRITKGIARYTSNFTPPASTFAEGTIGSSYDVFLAHMDGVAGSTTGLADQFGHVLTSGAMSLSSTQAKFGDTSAYFAPASNAWLDSAISTDYATGTNDFTWECWVWTDPAVGAWGRLVETSPYNSATRGWHVSYNGTDGGGSRRIGWQLSNSGGGGARLESDAACPTSQWVHLALVRSGNNGYMYINGVKQIQTLSLAGIDFVATNLTLGNAIDHASPFTGYIDEVRLTKGLCRYITNFTPPNAPFLNYDPKWSNVVALLHMNGANASTVFRDQKGHVFTAAGNAQISTAQAKWGNASAVFDGTGDVVTTPDSQDWNFGLGDFTIECFFRLAANTTLGYLINKRSGTAPYTPFGIFTDASGVVGAVASLNGTAFDYLYTSSAGTIGTGQWYHIALVRSGTTVSLYLDGVLKNSATLTGALFVNTTTLNIGANADGTQSLNGHIDELRITKGIARYTGAFTPPKTPFPHN